MRIPAIGLHFQRKQPQVSIGVLASGICFAQISRDGKGTYLEHLDSISCASTELDTQLQQLAKRPELTKPPCVLVMSPENYHLLRIDVPKACSEDEVQALVTEQVSAQLSDNLDDVVFDFFEPPDSFCDTRTRWVYVVVTEKAMIRRYTQPLLKAGFNLQAVDIAEMALRNLLTLLPPAEYGSGVLWLGANQSVLVLAQHHAICLTQQIDIGSTHLLHLKKTQVIFSEIDQMSVDALHLIVQPLVAALQQALCDYMQHFAMPPISRLVIAPVPNDLPQLPAYLTQVLGVPTSALQLDSLLSLPMSLPKQPQADCLLTLGAALREDELD